MEVVQRHLKNLPLSVEYKVTDIDADIEINAEYPADWKRNHAIGKEKNETCYTKSNTLKKKVTLLYRTRR